MATTLRHRLFGALAATTIAGTLLTGLAGTAMAASSNPWIAYGGDSINNARVPARGVDITTNSPKQFQTLRYTIGGQVRSTTATATLNSNGDWTATARVDLGGLAGRQSITAEMITGNKTSRVAKSIRVVDPATVADNGANRPGRFVTPAIPAGFPNMSTTGVRTATPLRVVQGDLIITQPGVVENLDVRGCLVVKASDVTVRNTKITCVPGRALAVTVDGAARNVVLEDSEIDGNGAQVAIGWGNYTLRRVDVHSTADGPRLGYNVLIEDSWIHDNVRYGDLHNDGMQTTSGTNIVVRHNSIDPSRGADPMNSAIMVGSETGSRLVKDMLVENNYLGGGSFTVNIRCDVNAQNVVFRNNTFADNSRYGQVQAPAAKITFAGKNLLNWSKQAASFQSCS
ncbi:hypothetical protein ACFFKU_07240 [Kineococcus gynurae]|uniref:Parallel beta helix pectate lyase-like protein n=1 Tax=Kineococcus gynurae TaxID=452979 RepID=A0ABV5LWT1_9ACTN